MLTHICRSIENPLFGLYMIEPVELFHRLTMTSLIDLERLKQIFKNVMVDMRESLVQNGRESIKEGGMRLVTQSQLGDIYWKTKDSMLLSAIEDITRLNHNQHIPSSKTVILLQKPHYYSLNILMLMRHNQSHTQRINESLDWEKVFSLNPNNFDETDQDQIEK